MYFIRKKLPLFTVLSYLFMTPVLADSTEEISNDSNSTAERLGWWSTFKNDVSSTWNTPQHHDVYMPVVTWHNRLAYSQDKIDKYNERPWGGGYGISRYDQQGNWHGIYLMVFKDSFNKWEPIGGYGYEKVWRPLDDQNFRLGLGYTAAVTARDNYNYIPLPLVLPLASVGYNRLTFQATYIPGTYNNGNVFFAWLRFSF